MKTKKEIIAMLKEADKTGKNLYFRYDISHDWIRVFFVKYQQLITYVENGRGDLLKVGVESTFDIR